MDQILSTVTVSATAIVIVLFALPSYIGVIHQKGLARGLTILAVTSLLFLLILGGAKQITFPFGNYTFADALGYKVGGVVPWTTAFAYTPILLAAFWLANKITSGVGRILLSAVFLTGMNAVIDPALAFMGIRTWESGGPFYAVPILNFVGWLVTGLITGAVLQSIWGKSEDDQEPEVGRSVAYSGFAIVWFWGGVNLGLNQWIPAAIGLTTGVLLLVLMYVERRRLQKANRKSKA